MQNGIVFQPYLIINSLICLYHITAVTVFDQILKSITIQHLKSADNSGRYFLEIWIIKVLLYLNFEVISLLVDERAKTTILYHNFKILSSHNNLKNQTQKRKGINTKKTPIIVYLRITCFNIEVDGYKTVNILPQNEPYGFITLNCIQFCQ